jgi:hypothetical protein
MLLSAAFSGVQMADDLLERMRQNPQAGWSIDDVARVCREHGISCAAPHGGGSHYGVFSMRMDHITTVPFRRPVKPIHIRRVVRFLDLVRFLELVWNPT